MFSLSVFSQSMTLIRNAVELTNNDTITYDFDSVTIYHHFDDIDIRNNTSNELNGVYVKKVYLNFCQNTANYMCWFVCSEAFVIGPGIIAANSTNTNDFSFHYNPQGQTGGSLIRYVFFRIGNPADSVCINVQFRHYVNVGTNEMFKNYLFTNAYPNPASNNATVNYSYSSEVNKASIVVNDLLGKLVKEIPLSDNQGKVSIITADISNGIYLYSLQLNGTIVNTRKLIVTH